MNIADFLPYVYAEAEGCPEVAALNVLRLSVREFCDASKAWRHVADPIYMYAGYNEFDIDVPLGAELAMKGIIEAEYSGAAVDIRTSEDLPANWRTETGSGITAIVPTRRTVLVYPTPTANDPLPLNLVVALRPALDATTCSDTLADWTEGITAGALARLKLMPNKPWTDREAVADLRTQFDREARKTLSATISGHAKRTMRITAWSKA